jgi:soluble lytic murein transglycosylase
MPIDRLESRAACAALAASCAFVLLGTSTACAQSSSEADGERSPESVRRAGDEATFRRIERFPDKSASTSEPPSTISSDTLPEELRRAVAAERWSEARKLLETSSVAADSPLSPVDVDFLAGYVAHRQDRHRSAMAFFDRVLDETTPLRDYAAYYAARSAFELKRFQETVLHAARLPVSSLLHPDGLLLLGRALIEAGTESDLERARSVFETHLEHHPDASGRREARARLASVLLDLGEWESAAEHGFRLLLDAPLSSEAERIRERLERHRKQLPERYRTRLDEPSREMRMAHFRALFEHHQSRRVIDELPDVASEWLDGSADWCQAIYWIGRSHTKLREHGEAVTWYERILEECGGVEPFERKALYLIGKGYWNDGQKEKALDRFEQLWTEFEGHSYADDAMYFAARIHRELGDDQQARDLAARQVKRYPDGDMASDAHWLYVRQKFAAGAYDTIVDYVDTLDSTGEQHRYTQGRLRYFRAVALQRSRDDEAARKGYLDVARRHPLSYYGLLAFNRLADMAGDEEGNPGGDVCGGADGAPCREVFGARSGETTETSGRDWEIPSDVRRDPGYRVGRALLRLGLRELASREFRALFDRVSEDDRALRGLAHLLDEAGAYPLASTLPARIGGWRSSYPDAETRRYWTIAHPRPFREPVASRSRERGIAESLIYAVIRKESRFNPTVGSSAGARGLMQLMPETARSVADTIGMDGFSIAGLLDAETNIRLGTAHLETLAGYTGHHPTLMAASYNGGWGSVSSWLDARSELPLGLWVEDIPWGQTRRYAKMVTANYWIYTWLYGESRVPRLRMEPPLDGGDD